MTLQQLIDALAAADQDQVVPLGFGRPWSYRGGPSDVAFVPETDVTVAAMLAEAQFALGETFHGYKGGQYTMGAGVDCYIAEYGSSQGDKIGPMLVAYMTGQARKTEG